MKAGSLKNVEFPLSFVGIIQDLLREISHLIVTQGSTLKA